MNRIPLILAVETSSRLGSVALARGADLLGESTFSATLRHSAEILPAIADLLDQFGHTPSDIRQVHISIGPGSFTGLRIAVAAAKAMHLANATEIVTVGSLDAIAANVTDAPTQPVIQNTTDNFPPVHRLAAILDAGAVILALPSTSELIAFKPTREAYAELARIKVAETPTYAHPVIAGNRIFVKDQETLSLCTME